MTTSAERLHLARVASLGCIVCGYSAEVHHLKHDPITGQHLGMGQRASHFHTIPLCPGCHRLGGYGVAYHAGPRAFELAHGTEIDLWTKTQRLLGMEVKDGAA